MAVTEGPETRVPGVESARTATRRALERAWAQAVDDGRLPALPPESAATAIEVVRPANPDHGDLSTNLALKLARPLRRPPLEIAAALRDSLAASMSEETGSAIADPTVAAPGFLNLRLAPGYVEASIDAATQVGSSFGRVEAQRPQRINVEFVSANPTGPLHIGNARGAFVGDLLCRVLEAAGHDVTREYYFNDAGTQVRNLGESVRRVRLGEPVPEDGYRGEYVSDLAREVPEEIWARAVSDEADGAWVIGVWASERVRAGIESSLGRLGVRFDVWRTETGIEREGWIDRSIERLREGGHVYESERALWFRSTAFGDDKDRVVRRSNGELTYFGKDIGYLEEKFSRGFDRLIYVWGADHHGTVARLRNAAEAMGYGRDAVEVLLVAWVRFVRDGQEISMSKRSGEFITLDELLAEIGADAARWYFAARAHTSGIDFDIELAKRQSNENPVYYVQYAHARISSILRKAQEAGLSPADSVAGRLADDPVALGLAKEILRLPELVEDAATAHETQGVTAYATQLATTFHAFYRDRRVIDPADPGTSGVRLALVDAARLALANTLALLGISAPESM